MAEFSGAVVVITGAGSGIGRATALLFGRLGARVHASDLDGDAAERVRAEIEAWGGIAAADPLDVTDAGAVEGLAQRVFGSAGRSTSSTTTPASATPRPSRRRRSRTGAG